MHPVLFRIGTFEVPSFGVMMVVAFMVGLWLATARSDRYGISKQQVQDVAFWALLAGIFGARLVFILLDLPHYLANPRELMTLRFQGLTSFGGLIFGAIALVLWSRKHGVRVLSMLDLAAPAFLLGHIIGRIGCLLNGCCFGGACSTELPWAIGVLNSPYRHHPAQVYDALMNLAGLGVLLWAERTGRPRLGQLTGLALVLHATARFIYEFWRAGTIEQVEAGVASSTYWGNLPITEAHAFAAVLGVFGLALLFAFRRNPPATEETE